MAKGSVLTAAFIDSVGLTAATYTLTSVPKVVIHPELQEPMFRCIQVEEFDDTVFLDRQYCFDQRFTVPSGYGVGDKILLWMRRVTRHPNRDEKRPPVSFHLASDCFLFDQPMEFQRPPHTHTPPARSKATMGSTRYSIVWATLASGPSPRPLFSYTARPKAASRALPRPIPRI